MPRPKNIILLDMFNTNESNEVVCNLQSCKNKILSVHSGNIERHLKRSHPEQYANYIEQKRAMKLQNCVNEVLLGRNVNPRNIELAIVELFTKNGRPLHMAEDRAFKIFMEPVLSLLGITVNEHKIMKRIIAFSTNIKTEISNDLKGTLFSLKIDVANRWDLSMLGINVQYIKNGKIIVKTLAIKELKSSHTGENIKSIILEVLKEYGVDVRNIFTITTDNGSNMLKTVKVLSSEFQMLMEEESQDSEEEVDCEISIYEIESIDFNISSHHITNNCCGAHTLQLCVNDVLKQPTIKEKTENLRLVVKKLRSKTYMSIFKNGLHKKPIIDCITRWNSTYNMIERLLEIREVVTTLSKDNSKLFISSADWSFASEFVGIFKPIYTATMKLQTEQLCYSELYIVIMDITFQIDALPNTEMKVILKESLKTRMDKLFDNELFNASMYLDPRMKVCMAIEQKTRAQMYIVSLYKQIYSKEDSTTDNKACTILDETPSTVLHAQSSSNIDNFESDLSTYERKSRLPLNANVLEYWDSLNIISGIANILLEIPSTQVSVERLFSAMKYMLSDQRN
ncbi:uncharacterized protein LOC131802660 [Musca domestica]|uniref:Uncharacterized protein LOC131802660 n=1 Tax=Musca domestica TaxID=7370 RepID=A0ABM3UZR8_MUSDO|nr:uncharacterized protein LOC131802660 [Musca domestica]